MTNFIETALELETIDFKNLLEAAIEIQQRKGSRSFVTEINSMILSARKFNPLAMLEETVLKNFSTIETS